MWMLNRSGSKGKTGSVHRPHTLGVALGEKMEKMRR